MKSDYQERKDARAESFASIAAKNASLSKSLYDQASKMSSVIPFGQPILVGHHSEKRDRNYRDKIHNKFGKAFEAQDKAEYYERRAESVESNNAISSDNPDAIELLKKKLVLLERNQQLMKDSNKIMKSKKLSEAEKIAKLMEQGLSEDTAKKVMEPVYGRVGIPHFRLTNNNATIRNTKERIAHLERLLTIQSSEEQFGDITLKTNTEDNRIQIFFPGKPSEEVRKKLKSNGFHWSPYVKAWMKMISPWAIREAKEMLKNL